jgi:hypothetical protein
MMEYLNAVRAGGRAPARAEVEPLVPLVAPFCPHLAEELWSRLGNEGSIFDAAPWPAFDEDEGERGHRHARGPGERKGAGHDPVGIGLSRGDRARSGEGGAERGPVPRRCLAAPGHLCSGPPSESRRRIEDFEPTCPDDRDPHAPRLPGPRGPPDHPARDRRGPGALHGCGAGGQLRASRYPDGAGAGRLPALAAPPAAQSREPRLAGPGPLRALDRARFHAPLFPSASHRLRPAAPGVAGLPPVEEPDARPSRVPGHPGRGDHDRPSGTGRRELRRDGAGRTVARGPVQPPGTPGDRPFHLCVLFGRGSHGGDLARGRRPGGPPAARKADLGFRRQRDHDRGEHSIGDLDRSVPAIRKLWLARAGRGGRKRPPGAGRGAPSGSSRVRAALLHRAQDHDRMGQPQQGRHGSRARRSSR